MKVAEFFSEYGEVDDVEIFRGEDLPAGLPRRPGLYAWFARLKLTVPSLNQGSTPSGLEEVISREIFERFQRPPYLVQMRASLAPLYEGQIVHISPHLSTPGPAECQAVLSRVFEFLNGPFSPLFSTPLYVGKAAQQTLDIRINQHLALLQDYLERPGEFLEEQRRKLVEPHQDVNSEEVEAHSFALEAAARRLREEKLILVTYSPPEINAYQIGLLETILNRMLFPICGRR